MYSCDAVGAPSVTSKCPCKPGAPVKPSSTLKNVLIIGDSLSIGYTPHVAANLSDIALVQHAPWDTSDGGAEESAYLDQCLEFWTAHPSGIPFIPDLIWFNVRLRSFWPSPSVDSVKARSYAKGGFTLRPRANERDELPLARTGAYVFFARNFSPQLPLPRYRLHPICRAACTM